MIGKRIKWIQITRYSIDIIGLSSFLYGVIAADTALLLFSCILLLLQNVLYAAENIYNNILFLGFNILFGLFLVGRMAVNFIVNQTYGIPFEDTTINTILLELCLSLITIFIGYSIKIKFTPSSGNQRPIVNLHHSLEECFKSACKYLFYFCVSFLIVETVNKAAIVQQYGYFTSYTIDSTLPLFIVKIATMSDYFFYGFCATLPSKKECEIPFAIFIIAGAFSILTGGRSEALLRFAFVIVYCFLRHKSTAKWITKKTWLLLLTLLPGLVWFVVWYGFARIGDSFSLNSIGKLFYTLFNEQGVSVLVLGYQNEFADANAMQQNFTFGQLWTFLTQNVFTQSIFGTHSYQQNTVDAALKGHSFGQTISYLVLGNEYLLGRGLGTSYIAEVMQDYGYIGLIVINLIFGKFMSLVKKIDHLSILKRLFACYAIQALLYAPRDTAIGPFMSMFTFSSLASLAIALFCAVLINSSKRIKGLRIQ